MTRLHTVLGSRKIIETGRYRCWRLFAVGLAFALFADGATRAQPTVGRLEATVQAYTKEAGGRFMGAVLVSSGGHIVLDKAYGLSSIARHVENTTSTRFLIGSLTKQFTAAEILKLRDRGRISLSQSLIHYLPGMPRTWSSITVGMLLSQSSGLPDFTEQPTWKALEAGPHDPEAAVESVSRLPLDFSPGAKYAYSNTNYVLLGLIISHVTGRSLTAALVNDLLKPLNMANSGLDEQRAPIPSLATGYQPAGDQIIEAPPAPTRVAAGAGAMYSTTGDLLRWSENLLAGRVIGATSLSEMTREEAGDYGYGIEVSHRDAKTILHHSGSIDGFNSAEYLIPSTRTYIFVLSNVNGPEPAIMSRQLLEEVLGEKVVLPEERQDLPIDGQTMRAVVGSYDFGHGLTTFVDEHGALILHGAHTTARLLYQGRQAGGEVFWLPERYMEITFAKISNGRADEATTSVGDVTRKGTRVETATPSIVKP